MSTNTGLLLDESFPMRIIQVAAQTNTKQLAGSIAEEVRKAKLADAVPNISLHAIGHGAVAQAIKSVPIVNGYIAPHGLQLLILPSFEDKMIDDENNPSVKVERTVIRMRLVPWRIGG
jgi:stage V sporulation protein S